MLLTIILLVADIFNPPLKGVMSCGKCGRPVKERSTVNCESCGADLRRAGIRVPDPNARRRVSTGKLTLEVILVVVMLLLTCVGGLFVALLWAIP